MFDPSVIAATLAKWALYVGALGATGTVLCALMFALDRARTVAACFAVMGLIGAVLVFLLKAVALTGDLSGISDPVILGLLWDTASGTSLGLHVLGLCGLLVSLLFRAPSVATLFGILALSGFIVVGHIADRGGVVLPMVLLVHLVEAAFWIGILFPLSRLAGDQSQIRVAAELGMQFGRVAVFAVPILLLAGVLMSYVLLGSISAIFGTAYGQLLIAKVVGVAGLVSAAAMNKLRFVPGMQAGDASAAQGLRNIIRLEAVAIAAILLITAILTTNASLPV